MTTDKEHAHGGHDHDHDHDHDERTPGAVTAHHEHRRGLVGWITELYRPHSHDAADSIDSALESSARGIRATKLSLLALLITATLQVLVVLVSGSVALLADTIHNFADALTSIPLWIAFVIGRRAASRSHTYGYRRAEDLAGLFIVLMIGLSAILVGWESVARLIEPRALDHLGIVMLAGLVGFAGNEIVAAYRIRVGRQIGSAALIADGYHARTDGFTSLAVVVAAIGVMLGFPQADPLVGLAITVVILLILRDAAKQVFGRLMDAVDPTLVEMVERVARGVPDVTAVAPARVRWVGHRLEAALHVTVDCDLTVAQGHRVGEDVRHALFHEIRGLEEVIVHVDPCDHARDDHHDAIAHHRGESEPRRPVAS